MNHYEKARQETTKALRLFEIESDQAPRNGRMMKDLAIKWFRNLEQLFEQLADDEERTPPTIDEQPRRDAYIQAALTGIMARYLVQAPGEASAAAEAAVDLGHLTLMRAKAQAAPPSREEMVPRSKIDKVILAFEQRRSQAHDINSVDAADFTQVSIREAVAEAWDEAFEFIEDLFKDEASNE